MATYDRVRTKLQQQLDELLRRVDKIEGDLRTVQHRDPVERASELENDAAFTGLDDTSRTQVEQARAALQRIESGTYGTCAICGQTIGAERLAALPTTVTCAACAAKA